MAMAPKSVGGPQASVVGGRPVSGAHNIARVDSAPISELTAQTGVGAETEPQTFQDYARPQQEKSFEQQMSRGRPFVRYGSNQDFLAVFEFAAGNLRADNDGPPQSFASALARATNIYETTARVISGAPRERGTGLNMAL